jgi:hypothetical protein
MRPESCLSGKLNTSYEICSYINESSSQVPDGVVPQPPFEIFRVNLLNIVANLVLYYS